MPASPKVLKVAKVPQILPNHFVAILMPILNVRETISHFAQTFSLKSQRFNPCHAHTTPIFAAQV
jgi:hypothetical protein